MTDTSGAKVLLAPGESVETYEIPTDSFLTTTSDSPYWVPYLAAQKTVTAASAGTETQAIDPATYRLRIESVSVEVEVWLHDKTDPTHQIRSSLLPSGCPLDIITDGRVATIVLEFSEAGEAVLSEMRV